MIINEQVIDQVKEWFNEEIYGAGEAINQAYIEHGHSLNITITLKCGQDKNGIHLLTPQLAFSTGKYLAVGDQIRMDKQIQLPFGENDG